MKNSRANQIQNEFIKTEDVLDIIFYDRLKYASFLSDALDHELITPLVIIRGLTESLLRHPEQNPQANLREISRETENLLKILEAMSFVEPSDQLKIQSVPLRKVVDQAIIFFEKTCLEKGISMRVEVDDDLIVESEPNRLKSILVSLIQNAVESFENKSSRELKSITVHVQNTSDQLHLIISDTGVGMSHEAQTYITNDVFLNRKPLEINVNLGLALAHKIAKDLMHKLSFVSEKLRGTSFTLTFLK